MQSRLFAHGTGTTLNDSSETKALKRAFGDAAYQMKITVIKSMVGHALGAAGAHKWPLQPSAASAMVWRRPPSTIRPTRRLTFISWVIRRSPSTPSTCLSMRLGLAVRMWWPYLGV